MTPEFRDLVGDDLTPEEAARLEGVHRLLVEAGPPAELPPELAAAPRPGAERPTVSYLPKRRRGLSLALAATIGVLAFSLGTLWGREDADFDSARVVQMHGVGTARSALASVEIGDRDDGGNYPMLVKVRGLRPVTGRGSYYELLLTKDGKVVYTCGVFNVRAGSEDEPTEVQLSVPYNLDRKSWYDGWIVVRVDEGERGATVMTT
jgi:hypothetical protein